MPDLEHLRRVDWSSDRTSSAADYKEMVMIDFQDIIQRMAASPQGEDPPNQDHPSYAVDYNLVPSASKEYLQSRVGGAFLALRRK